MTRLPRLLLLLLLFLAPLVACGGYGAPARWAGRIDTLPSGVVVVRNPAQGLWDEDAGWSVREELRIGSALSEGPDLFGSVAGIAVDGRGRIHVLDRQAKELRTFAPDGRHVRTVGREGGGPGEFRDPIGLAAGPDGETLYVVDPRNARYAVFSMDAEPRTQFQRAVGGYSLPWDGGFDAAGRFHENVFAAGGHAVLVMDSGFQPADTARFPGFEAEEFVLTTESGRISTTVPFAPDQVERWDPRGYLWTARTGEYTLTRMDMEGDTVRVIHGPPVPPIPVTEADRDEALEGLEWFRRQGGRVDPGRIPSAKPPVSTFHVAADGHIWVRLTGPADEVGARYHVFDPEGRFLGTVTTAEGLGSAPVFTDGAVYGVVRDSLGVQYIVRNALRDGAVAGDGD
ncbi:MAG TPA: 6-bladed beta-propeller [Longimicrobiales bacterium]|nr:6-bladed beta-propeller [Longimicrobiales bacterium]